MFRQFGSMSTLRFVCQMASNVFIWVSAVPLSFELSFLGQGAPMLPPKAAKLIKFSRKSSIIQKGSIDGNGMIIHCFECKL